MNEGGNEWRNEEKEKEDSRLDWTKRGRSQV